MTTPHPKHRLFAIIVLLALPAAALPVSCERTHEADPVSSTPTVDDSTPTTQALVLEGEMRSKEKHPGGLGPDGQVWDHQYLSFSSPDGTFEWRTADIVLRGTFRVEGDRVRASGEGRTYEGRLDHARGILIWEGVEFERP